MQPAHEIKQIEKAAVWSLMQSLHVATPKLAV